ncbi:MAG TPA: tetratricopeptide repeat protein [Chthoniobacterales bacterium]|nr:tetratricopeptide repeat protein [Chthoniobacterales bacterium]
MKKILAPLLIVAAVGAIYAPALRNKFVWDDTALVLRDPLIRSWRLIPEGFNHFLFTDATPSDFYRPLQRVTYTLEYIAVGFQPMLYHLSSIILHAAAAVALFVFTQELLLSYGLDEPKRRLIASVATLVWAIHPIHSPAVAYVAGRADPLAALFGFAGLYLVIRSTRATSANKWRLFIAAGLAFLLSAFSKESGLIFPLVALMLFVTRKRWLDMWKTVAVAGFVAAIYFSLRLGAEHYHPPALSPPAPPLVRPIIAARAIAEYAGLILLPLNLHVDRDVETHPSGWNDASLRGAAWRELQTLLGLVLMAALLCWGWRARKANPAVFTLLLLALISYLPVSGIVPLNATVAEHWLYVPSAFLFFAGAVELGSVGFAIVAKRVAVGVLTLWLLFLGSRTFVRTFDWKDQRTFCERAVMQSGDSARMLINLGSLEANEGRLQEAATHLRAALQKKPDQPLAVINLAVLALKQNDLKLARQLLERATHMPLVDAQGHELLAVLKHKENGTVDVLRMRLAAHTGPPDWSIEKRYIQVLDQTGATSSAVNELLTCLQTQWYRAESWQLLGQLHAKLGHSSQADRAFAQAHDYDVHLASRLVL